MNNMSVYDIKGLSGHLRAMERKEKKNQYEKKEKQNKGVKMIPIIFKSDDEVTHTFLKYYSQVKKLLSSFRENAIEHQKIVLNVSTTNSSLLDEMFDKVINEMITNISYRNNFKIEVEKLQKLKPLYFSKIMLDLKKDAAVLSNKLDTWILSNTTKNDKIAINTRSVIIILDTKATIDLFKNILDLINKYINFDTSGLDIAKFDEIENLKDAISVLIACIFPYLPNAIIASNS